MRSLRTSRVARAAGVATVAVIALAGCSTGQVAETAVLQAPINGLNTASPDGGLLIRNLQVSYNSPTGYAANSSAPLEVVLVNTTKQAITVLVSSKPQQDVTPGVVSAQQVGVTGAPSASGSAGPSAAPEPSAAAPEPSTSGSAPAADSTAALQPARFTIAPLSSQSFLPDGKQKLMLAGLSGALRPGSSVSLVFESSTGNQPLEVLAPVAIPLSPVSRAPGIENENSEE
jgi:hypothetical protein